MDQISELPTSLIHHIMSYLSAERVARTSILSKRWNQMCISNPIFGVHLASAQSFWLNC
ncbi:hypothetical protein CUMW_132470 [Citrus unshiu]|uniref:F-box domain-containing protein n=1 Tax=Citrus unshiu TaxID=55188 RepID=A0A2H5PFT3_CITUN|nr:hypothetical protein CUMW_132470 [Citrus unshiu]